MSVAWIVEKLISGLLSSTPQYKTRTETQKIAEIFCDGVLRLQNKEITAVLTIPHAVPNTNTMHCNVVQVSYELKVEATTQGCHKNIDLVTPIVIGTIPLMMDPSSPQPTFGGKPGLVAPVQPFSDVPAVIGNYQQNNAVYPPANGNPGDFINFSPQSNFNAGYPAPYPPATAPYDQRKNNIYFL